VADLDKQMEGVSKGIKNLVKNLSDVNEGVAENAASIASSNKDTFTGFLARSKLRKMLEKADTAELQKKTQQVARAEKANAKAEAAVVEKQKLIEEEVNASKKIADIREKVAILNASKENASTAEQLKIQDQINAQTSQIAAETLAIQQTHSDDLGELTAKHKQKTDALDKRMEERTALEQEFNDKLAEASTSQEFDQFSGALKDLTGGTIDLGGWADSAVKTFDNIGTVFSTLKGGAMKLGGALSSGFSAVTASLGKVFAPITAMLKAGFMALKTAVMPFLAAMYATAATLLATAGAFLVANAPIIAIVVGVLLLAGLLIWGAMKLYESSETFREIIDVVMGYFSEIVTAIGDIFGGFFDFFKGLFTGDFDLMFQGVKDIFGGLWDLIKAPFKAIGDFFKSVFDIDIWAILRRFAEKILPTWLVNKIFGDKGKGSDPKPEGDPIDVNKNIDEDGNEIAADEKKNAMMEKFKSLPPDKQREMAKKFGIKMPPGEEETPVQTVATEALGEEEGNPYERMTDMEAEELQLRKKALEVIRQEKEQGLADLEARYEKGEVDDKQYAMMKRSIMGTHHEEIMAIRNNASNSFVLEDLRAAEAQERGVDIAGVGLGAYGGDMSTEELQKKGYQDRNAQLYDWQRDPANKGKSFGEFEAKDHLRFDDKTSAQAIAEGTEDAKDKGASGQAIVTTVNAPTTNAANTTVSAAVPTPRDTDPTGSRLAAVPA
tara:strand:- start:1533 stop:3698 length:2166 start_codon:yes stop_codon:yes gene_type:complete